MKLPFDGKKTLALATSIIGAIIFVVGLYYKGHLEAARHAIDAFTAPLGNNPFSSTLSSHAKGTLSSYAVKIHIFMAFGAVLTALGASYLVYLRQKKH